LFILVSIYVFNFLAAQNVVEPEPESEPVSSEIDYPEHVTLTMPALSPTMNEGTITSFHVSVGDEVEAGDSIATVETDKANMEFEVQDEGVIAWINTNAVGNKIKLGEVCAIMVETKDQVAAFKDYVPGKSNKTSTPKSEALANSEPEIVTKSSESDIVKISSNIFISPRALNKFLSQGFTKTDLLSRLSVLSEKKPLGSGPNNRIIEQDVEGLITALKTPPKTEKVAKVETPKVEVAGAYKEVELSTMRRVIAERLSQSKREIPHYYLEAELRMDALLEMKKELQTKAGIKLSVNDFIVKAVAKASKEVPDCNTNFVDNKIRFFENVDVRYNIRNKIN
jgi:pyruvate dehydrogenase E2 component (dihydrolipoamide acetyltransferase)